MILKPATQNAAAPQVSFKHDGVEQSEIRFPETAAAGQAQMTVDIVNSGSVPLSGPTLAVKGTDPTSKDVFGLVNDHITGLNELGPNQTATVDVTFAPLRPGTYSGVLSVAATNLGAPATIRIAGSARAEAGAT